jgi:hypothetical protein
MEEKAGLGPEQVRSALLRHNFLPDQSTHRDEIPPCFTAETFSDAAAAALVKLKPRINGYDESAYRMTRHNLVPRVGSIPHPQAYARLVDTIAENWSAFAYVENNSASRIRPMRRPDDERIIVRVGYDEDDESDGLDLEDSPPALPPSLGKRFEVKTDVLNFYPSIYSHSLPWALVGKSTAKTERNDKTAYFNILDTRLRALRRGETKGISIGPGTSNIVSEAILSRIDESLLKRFTYTRYIDDYTFFAADESEAHQFLNELENELAEYRLNLNPRKTTVKSLPYPEEEPWVNQLSLQAPVAWMESRSRSYLDLAVALGLDYPDGSTIKFAARRLLSDSGNGDPDWLVDQVAALSFHRPIVLPLLSHAYAKREGLVQRHSSIIVSTLLEAAARRRSDVMCWSLYYLGVGEIEVPSDAAAAVVASGDPLAMSILLKVGSKADKALAVSYVKGLGSDDEADLDRHWFLINEMNQLGLLPPPYESNVFRVLKDNGVQMTTDPASWARPAEEDDGPWGFDF